jgi:dihydroorotase
MTEFDYDLLIRAGRIVCTQTAWGGPGAVAIRGDRIVAVGAQVNGTARQSLDFPEALLLPGLVDLHAHPAKSGSKYGVDPDLEFLPRGVTTVLSQGDAGADNWPEYRSETIEGCRTRVRLAICLSNKGEPEGGPCFRDIDWVDVEACVQAILGAGDLIWGIAVNVSRDSCTLDYQQVVRRALHVTELTGKPLLYGMRNPPDWPIAEQLALLRPGDVVTYIFRDGPWSIVGDDGRVLPEVREARERGVLFDACHGMQSFSFRVAEAALADGFYPDTISTDQYARHVGSQPRHDRASS